MSFRLAFSIASSHRSYVPIEFTVLRRWFLALIVDRMASMIWLKLAPHSINISSRSCRVKTRSTSRLRGALAVSYSSKPTISSSEHFHPILKQTSEQSFIASTSQQSHVTSEALTYPTGAPLLQEGLSPIIRSYSFMRTC